MIFAKKNKKLQCQKCFLFMALFFHAINYKRHHVPYHFELHIRTFVDAKIKWVRDPYLDKAVQREKNLKSLFSLKTLILSHPSKTLPISTISPQKPLLLLPPTTADKFFQDYPSLFQIFRPSKPLSLPHVKLTPQALSLHKQETQILNSSSHKRDVAERLTKLLMLTKTKKLPLYVLEKFKYDMGLPHNYILTLLPDFPEYFQICDMGCNDLNGGEVFGLELISWRDDLAISSMEKRVMMDANCGIKRGMRIGFPMNLPRGFDLEKNVKNWVDEWQNLPYISPYEDAFHLAPNSDQAEKWAVAVIHELLHLMVGKKTEKNNIFCLGDYLGFGKRFKRALVHHPGIFYVSNKIRTQIVVLREAYRKDILVEKHQLMEMWYQYIDLMNRVWRWGKLIRVPVYGCKKRVAASAKGGKRKGSYRREKVELYGSSESEVGM